jgi:glutamate-1-semialdehyde 2,1-aminomutase
MLREGLARVAARRGVPLQALGEGPIAQPIFINPTTRVTADHDLRSADGKKATRLGYELIRRGVFVIPGAKMYISLAHTDADIARTLEVFDDALMAL